MIRDLALGYVSIVFFWSHILQLSRRSHLFAGLQAPNLQGVDGAGAEVVRGSHKSRLVQQLVENLENINNNSFTKGIFVNYVEDNYHFSWSSKTHRHTWLICHKYRTFETTNSLHCTIRRYKFLSKTIGSSSALLHKFQDKQSYSGTWIWTHDLPTMVFLQNHFLPNRDLQFSIRFILFYWWPVL